MRNNIESMQTLYVCENVSPTIQNNANEKYPMIRMY